MLNGVVKIIGGEWRSRRIRFETNASIKPTPSRVRETLFNWLAPTIDNAYCLDLFAGSGALGLEALSRGAEWVGFVERSHLIARTLQRHVQQLNATNRSYVYRQSYQELNEAQLTSTVSALKPIDIIFLDPPFKQNMLLESLDWIAAQSFVSPNVYIYMEYESELTLPASFSANWQMYREQQAGRVRYGLWTKMKS